MGVNQWIDVLLGPFGLAIGLIWALVGVLRGWWVPGKLYKNMEADRDEWKEIALKGIAVGEKAVRLVANYENT